MKIKIINTSYLFKIIAIVVILNFIKIGNNAMGVEIINNTGSRTQNSFAAVVINFINWSLVIVGFVTLILLILERFIITSVYDKKETEDIRKFLTWIIIGLVVMLIAFKIFAYR